MTVLRPTSVWLATAALAALLSACATPRWERPPTSQSAAQQSLQGQLSVKLEAFRDLGAKGINLGFFFNGSQQAGQLDLMTPMGSQVAQVRWSPGGAWLRDDRGGERYFETLGELSDVVLGEPLPLAALMHWLSGKPDPQLPSPTDVQPDSFDQAGWHVDTSHIGIGRLSAERSGSPQQRGIAMRVRLDPP